MKTTRNIKKVLAFILAMVMCMSVTVTAFAMEPQWNTAQETVEPNDHVGRAASQSLRFTYPDTQEVRFSVKFKNLQYYVSSPSSEPITVKFKGEGLFTGDKYLKLTPNIVNDCSSDIPTGTYTISVTQGSANYINFYFWS